MQGKKKAGESTKDNPHLVQKEYSKAQILASEKYRGRRDLLSVLLAEGGKYTIGQVDKEIETFMKRKVE